MKVSCGIGPLLLRLLPEGGRCPLTAAALSVPPASTPLARCAKEYRCQAAAMTATVLGRGLSPRGEGHLPSATGSGRSAEGRDWGDVGGGTVSSTSWNDTFLHPGVSYGRKGSKLGCGERQSIVGETPRSDQTTQQTAQGRKVGVWLAGMGAFLFLPLGQINVPEPLHQEFESCPPAARPGPLNPLAHWLSGRTHWHRSTA